MELTPRHPPLNHEDIGWNDIDVMLIYLGNNFGIDWKDAKERAGTLAAPE